jgi:hypothetical protein
MDVWWYRHTNYCEISVIAIEPGITFCNPDISRKAWIDELFYLIEIA